MGLSRPKTYDPKGLIPEDQSSLQPDTHFTRHAVSAIIRLKKNPIAPAMIAPAVLVAAKLIPRSITDVRIVPRIPVRSAVILEQIQFWMETQRTEEAVTRAIARYTMAIPNVTQENAAVIVMVAVMVKNAVITPMRMLAITEITVQPSIHFKFIPDIKSPPDTIYALQEVFANKKLIYKGEDYDF